MLPLTSDSTHGQLNKYSPFLIKKKKKISQSDDGQVWGIRLIEAPLRKQKVFFRQGRQKERDQRSNRRRNKQCKRLRNKSM